MRKKVGNEDPTLRERQEIMHRKAAALAWFKHGRKGSAVLGNGREGKMQNPLLHAPRARRHQANGASEGIGHHTYNAPSMRGDGPGECIRHHTYDASSMGSDGASEYTGAYDKEGIPTMYMSATLVPPFEETPYHNLAMHQVYLSPMHQPSRFKAEALALRNPSPFPSSSSSSSSTDTDTTSSQFLALLSVLPHHQSQNCFNLSKKGCNASSSNSDMIDAIAASPWDCGSSLYDSFELLSLYNQLNCYLATTNATLAASSSLGSSSSHSKIIKNLASSPFHGPSLQPSYIPRSPYSLPQFMIPHYLAPKSSKKRSSLIHPIFSIPHGCNSTPLPPLPAFSSPLHSQGKKSPSAAEDHVTRKHTESGGFRRAFNSLLKSLHIKEDPAHQKPKRSNLSDELEKLPKNSRAPLRYEDPAAAIALNRSPNSNSSSCRAEMGSQRLPTSPSSAAAMGTRRRSPNSSSSAAASRRAASASSASTYHQFRNEGFRTTSRPPKATKWLQPTIAS